MEHTDSSTHIPDAPRTVQGQREGQQMDVETWDSAQESNVRFSIHLTVELGTCRIS